MASDSSSVNPFFGFSEEEQPQVKQEVNQQFLSSVTDDAVLPEGQSSAAPAKKRRNLPGNPDPDAEVIALSPNSLLATNRFICEVCNKGFQREQNLQLHRRGHNLPWKLKQKSPLAVRRRVYLCPEPTCIHHDPSRALGDLTGIKKHFSRKHGEKKFKCDKCSKRYAVQSDWKAHSKTCGTREHRCDCGTLFSRRDSFISHRAFCAVLAQDTKPPILGHHLYSNNSIPLSLSQVNSQLNLLQNQTNNSSTTNLLHLNGASSTYHFDHQISQPSTTFFRGPQPPTFTPNFHAYDQQLQHQNFHGLMQASATTGMMSDGGQYNNINENTERMMLFTGNQRSDNQLLGIFNSSNNQNGPANVPQISATSLLQKAAQMGSTTSERSSSILEGFMTNPAYNEVTDYFYSNPSASDQGFRTQLDGENNIQSLMTSLANGSTNGLLGGMMTTFTGDCTANGGCKEDNGSFSAFNSGSIYNMNEVDDKFSLTSNGGLVVSDGHTRDFLGVGDMVNSMHGGGTSEGHSEQLQYTGIHMI